MSVVYSVSAIQTLLGDEYQVKSTSRGRGSLQVNLVLKGASQFVQGKRLYAAFDKLQEAGYAVEEGDLRFSMKGQGDNAWRPWPCIFVNKPETEATTSSTDAVTAAFEALKAMGFKIVGPDGQSPTVTPDHVEPPSEETTPV